MHTSPSPLHAFRILAHLVFLPQSLARIHQLPHEVVNVTRAATGSAPDPTWQPLLCDAEPVTEFVTYTQSCPAPTSSRTIHSLIFPSPDASPIEVTAQSQVVTSFAPQMTWCVPEPIAISPLSAAPYLNSSASYTAVMNSTANCETVYAPLETTVCATTLTGLASKVTITDCDQEVTFSTEYGFTLETPAPITSNSAVITPAPIVQRLFTYWLAPWQSLTAGEAPSDVDVKICSTLDDGSQECTRYQEVWEVVVVTKTLTSTTTLEIFATVTGPGTLYVQTSQSLITNTVKTIDLSTTLLLETEVETESTKTGRKSTDPTQTVTGSTSTMYITKTLYHALSKAVNSSSEIIISETSEPEPEETSTVKVTSKVTRTSTRTITRPRPRPSS